MKKNDQRNPNAATKIVVSVPNVLLNEIRAQIGRREFARFVATSLARELIDRSRAALVAKLEATHGPVDAELVRRLEVAFAR